MISQPVMARSWRTAFLGTLLCVASLPALALDPNLPPSGNFDLTTWRLTLPVDSSGGFTGTPITIYQPELSQGYSYSPYFYTGSDGAMVFGVPYNGAAGGTSSHPRSEHREIHPNNDQHNWLPRDNGGTHRMDASCTVTSVGAGGVVCIGQIHTDDISAGYAAIMLFFDNSVSPSRVTAKIKTSASKISGNHYLYFPNIAPGQTIDYQLRIDGSTTSCVFYATVNGVTQSFDMQASDSRYANELFYYKAGAYYTEPISGQTAVVKFYQLDVTHGNSDTSPIIVTTSLPNGTVGTPYGQTLSASNGNLPLVWSLDSGTLPAGLTLTTAGVITGTPTTAGTSNFTVAVDDADSDFDTQALSLSIAAAPPAQVAAPVFTPPGGTYTTAPSVSMSSATSGASIRYTTNGTNPTSTSGTLYTGPVTIATSTTVKALAYKSGMMDSAVTTAAYTISSGGSTAPVTYEIESAEYDPAYWQLVSDSAASGGFALKELASGSPASGGSLSFSFNKNTSGSIYVHVRGRAPNGTASDTCWVRIDGGTWYRLNFANSNTYSWDDKPYSGLSSGSHAVEVRCGEANTVIDQIAILLTSTPPN